MAIRFSYCRYRLLFKRPFGTAHGTRDGTDALFIRLEEGGNAGYGEVTLPPYVSETIAGSMERIEGVVSKGPWNVDGLLQALDDLPELAKGANGCRAAVNMALLDLSGKQRGMRAWELLAAHQARVPVTLMTIGICAPAEVAARLTELPVSGAMKVKIGDPDAAIRIKTIMALDNRRLFLDGNQGCPSMDYVEQLIDLIGLERLLGIEQPFGQALDEANRQLGRTGSILVYGDESIRDEHDLVEQAAYFGGVNLKLMKCGGLDRAMSMASLARSKGMSVMLGSMSESSLGCSAMAQLAGLADITDLDGPWLIKNDPFEGLGMRDGTIVLRDLPGLGIEAPSDLEFTPIGA